MKPHPPERKETVLRLRAQGLGYGLIAKQTGISPTTIRAWLNPKYAERLRAESRKRKKRYRGVCIDCGGPTSYAGGSRNPIKRCLSCQQKYAANNRTWSREKVIAAIQRWAREHEGRPPTTTQWQRRGAYHPSYGGVYGHPRAPFKGWADAIEAAGFPRPIQKSFGPGRIMWSVEEAKRLRREGLPDKEIAQRMGVSPAAIHHQLGRRTPIYAPVPKKRTREQRIADLQQALKENNDG